jgi:hypothetical protein
MMGGEREREVREGRGGWLRGERKRRKEREKEALGINSE